jgi:ABC-type branched-subunit amino acid transport system substrate-binding protein
MRRQVILPVLAVILALVAGMVTGAASQTTDEVRIGIVSPLTGPAAKFGQAQKNAMTMAAEDVNAAGGIKSLGGAKIKLFFGDTRGEADTGVTETERLITRDKVHALIGAFQSGVGFPSSAMAEKHQVPWVTFGTFDKITERGFKYVFRAHANDTIKAKTLIDGLVALGVKSGPIKSAVIMSENTEWGKSVGEKQKNFLEKLGVKVHFVENYPFAAPDLTSLIVKAKAVSPDLVVADSYLGDALLITRQMAEQELRPTVYAAGGGGHVQPDFLKGAGKLSEGIFAATMWDAAVGKNVPWIAKDNDRHVARFGAPFTEDSAGYYQGFYVIVDALERTKKLGTKEVLYTTRDIGWGCDTALYRSAAQLRQELPARLAGGARVLKRLRGHSGNGVWKVELDTPAGTNGEIVLKVRHAQRESVEERTTLEAFCRRCESYDRDGGMLDQAWQVRLPEGMIRCYLVHGRVEGFGHQAINALYPAPPGAPEAAPPPGPRLYHPPTLPAFQLLKQQLEQEWVPALQRLLGIDTNSLPVLWDCDFLLGPTRADGADSYVLCEINASSVSPFPAAAVVPVARAALARAAGLKLE